MNSRRRPLLIAGASLLAGVLLCQWWILWPQRTAERFAGLLGEGQIAQASALLDGPSSIEIVENGDVLVQDRNGESVTISAGRLPFLPGQISGSEPPSRGVMDVLYGRDRLAISATGAGQAGEREGIARTVYLAVELGHLHIDAVE